MNNSDHFDATIIGAGIAGCAAAHHLAASGWKVALLHAGREVRGMESLSPPASRQLTRFRVNTGQPLAQVTAFWGSTHPASEPTPEARIVERSSLARALRTAAVQKGVTFHLCSSRPRIDRKDDRWEIRFESPHEVRRTAKAAYIIDASGRAAVASRQLGAARRSMDYLCSVSFSAPGTNDAGLWTESVPEGWWNLCTAADGASLSFVSQPEIIQKYKGALGAAFARTQISTLARAPQFETATSRLCGSSILQPCAGHGWAAIGDAAVTVQPLASAGVAKALRDAAMVQRALLRPRRYNEFQQTGFRDYLRELNLQYALESRWSTSAFWLKQTRPAGSVPSFATETASPTLD